MALFRIGATFNHLACWPQVEPLFRSSSAHGVDWESDDVKSLLDDGGGLLWIVSHGEEIVGAWVTRLITGKEKYAEISDLAGERFDEWMQQGDELLTQWARDMGCKSIRFYGRSGWSKKLAGLGYKVKRIEGMKHV